MSSSFMFLKDETNFMTEQKPVLRTIKHATNSPLNYQMIM